MNVSRMRLGQRVVNSRSAASGRPSVTRARKGVTLMELIVALTVTGFMAAIGTATFTSIIDNRHLIRESTAPIERVTALRETLRQWLLPATIQIQTGVPTGRGATSNVRTTINNRVSSNGADGVAAAATSTEDELVFTTSAPNPTNGPNARLRLFIDTDEETPETGLTLEYQINQQSPLQRRMLDSTITGLTVEYLNRQNNQWVTAANATGVRAKAVRITLMPSDPSLAPPLMSLPMTVGIAAAVTQSANNPAR